MLAETPKCSAEGLHGLEGMSSEDGASLPKSPAAVTGKVIIILDDSDSENDNTQTLTASSSTTNAPTTPTSYATSNLHSLTLSQTCIPSSPKKEPTNQIPNASETIAPLPPTNLPPTNFVDLPEPEPLITVTSNTNMYFAAAKNPFQSQFDPEIFDMQFTAQGRSFDTLRMKEILRGFKTKRVYKVAAKRRI
jgi:hypothetical protein